jgi:alpha-amylase/alpha-mannosidase (GH57 family)
MFEASRSLRSQQRDTWRLFLSISLRAYTPISSLAELQGLSSAQRYSDNFSLKDLITEWEISPLYVYLLEEKGEVIPLLNPLRTQKGQVKVLILILF